MGCSHHSSPITAADVKCGNIETTLSSGLPDARCNAKHTKRLQMLPSLEKQYAWEHNMKSRTCAGKQHHQLGRAACEAQAYVSQHRIVQHQVRRNDIEKTPSQAEKQAAGQGIQQTSNAWCIDCKILPVQQTLSAFGQCQQPRRQCAIGCLQVCLNNSTASLALLCSRQDMLTRSSKNCV